MSRQRHLQLLRDENNGYNPERLEDNAGLKVIEVKRDHLVLLNKESGEEERWTKSVAETEAEYIEKWPRQYAVEYKGKFYYKAG